MVDGKYIEQLKKLVLDIVDINSYAIFLFGGRARGRVGKRVDVDIGLLGKKPVPLELIGELHSAVNTSIIPYKVDFVDFISVDETFKQIALKDIEIWNRPNIIKIK